MIGKPALIVSGLSLGFLCAMPVSVAMPHGKMESTAPKQTHVFHPIAQPLWLKGIITTGGLGLVGLELWWFLGKKGGKR